MNTQQKRLVWRIAALLLDYPTQELELLDQLREAARDLPRPAGPALRAFIDYAGTTPHRTLAERYLETFDLRRRHGMHLAIRTDAATHGRHRVGGALGDHELPDHLPAVLQFAARADSTVGEHFLGEHVPVLELMRLTLADDGSPYTNLLFAIMATLPPVTTADRRRIAELAAQSPPGAAIAMAQFALEPAAGTRG